MQGIKAVFDPKMILNPGKIFPMPLNWPWISDTKRRKHPYVLPASRFPSLLPRGSSLPENYESRAELPAKKNR